MSLDSFVGGKKVKKTKKAKTSSKAKKTTKPKKPRKSSKKSTSSGKKKKKSDQSIGKPDIDVQNTSDRKKYFLECGNAKCKFKRTLKKRILSDTDYICRKCGKEMKIKKTE
jgi:hypothetical protein